MRIKLSAITEFDCDPNNPLDLDAIIILKDQNNKNYKKLCQEIISDDKETATYLVEWL